MKDRLTYLFATWLLAFCGLFFAFVYERSERIRLNDELTILGAKIPVYAQSNDEMADAADEAIKKLAACEEQRKAGK